MIPALCGRCGAPLPAGAGGCGFCGVSFVVAPGASPAASAPGSAYPQVVAALRAGNKIEAIRLHREHHKSSLRDAKDAVDRVEAQLGIRVG